jgi:ribosomal protein S18
MNKLIEIKNSEIYSKQITLKKEYQGHVIKWPINGGCTNFQYVIKPCADISSFIICVDDTIMDDKSYSGYGREIRSDIERAIYYLVNMYKQESIDIIGVELFIRDFIVHDVDYRYHSFMAKFVDELRKLFYQKGTKILNRNQYQITEQKYEPNVKPAIYIEDKLNKFITTNHPQISFKNRWLRLPSDIVESIDFRDYNSYSDYIKYCLIFRIHPRPISFGSNRNFISVKCEFERKHMEINACINDALKNFMAELEEDNIHLGEFSMEFDFDIIPPKSEIYRFSIVNDTIEYTSIIHWKFKEIFMKYGTVYE